MNRRLFSTALLAALAIGFTAAPAFAQTTTWTIDPNHSQVDFQIAHMAVSTVRGSLAGVTGTIVWNEKDPSKSSVTATIDATTVSTNNNARDKHLKSPDFFDVDKNPTLTFKSTSVVRANGKLQVIGDLTLAGVTKPITLTVDGPTPPQKNQKGIPITGFSASGLIKRSDFNFGAKFGAPVLGDDVKFTIDIEADQQ